MGLCVELASFVWNSLALVWNLLRLRGTRVLVWNSLPFLWNLLHLCGTRRLLCGTSFVCVELVCLCGTRWLFCGTCFIYVELVPLVWNFFRLGGTRVFVWNSSCLFVWNLLRLCGTRLLMWNSLALCGTCFVYVELGGSCVELLCSVCVELALPFVWNSLHLCGTLCLLCGTYFICVELARLCGTPCLLCGTRLIYVELITFSVELASFTWNLNGVPLSGTNVNVSNTKPTNHMDLWVRFYLFAASFATYNPTLAFCFQIRSQLLKGIGFSPTYGEISRTIPGIAVSWIK